MSLNNSSTKSHILKWDVAKDLVVKLYKDKNYRMSAFVGVGIMTGLRISDIRRLKWKNLISDRPFTIKESRTGKSVSIKFDPRFLVLLKSCFVSLNVGNPDIPFLISQKRAVYSVQRLNVILKEINAKYNLGIDNITCHTLRKTYARRWYDTYDGPKNVAISILSQVLSQSSTSYTKEYIGLTNETDSVHNLTLSF